MSASTLLCKGAVSCFALATLLTFGCGSNYDKPPPPSSPPTTTAATPTPQPAKEKLSVWQPDPALLDKLEPYWDFDVYQIRIPKGYNSLPVPRRTPGCRMFTWGGPTNSDGTRPILVIAVGYIALANADEQKEIMETSLEEAAKKFAQAGIAAGKSMQLSDVKRGVINGLEFLKARMKFTRPGIPLAFDGIMYICKDNAAYLFIQFADTEENFKQSEELGTAALLTFRKRQ